jgi:hypothetical protein
MCIPLSLAWDWRPLKAGFARRGFYPGQPQTMKLHQEFVGDLTLVAIE